MTNASVKSFRIADLLDNKNSNAEEKSENKPSEPVALSRKSYNIDFYNKIGAKTTGESGSDRSSTPVVVGTIDLRKTSTSSPGGSPSSSNSEDCKSERSPTHDNRQSTTIKYDAGNINGGLYQYHHHSYPIIYPLSPLPINGSTNSSTGTESAIKNFSSLLPYSFETFRQNRHLLSRQQIALNPLMLPSVSALTPGGHVTQGLEYPLYHQSLHGIYGLPTHSSITGLHEKGSVIGNRDNMFSVFHLGRPLYPGSCKRKGGQIRFSSSQTAQLEKAFIQQKYLNANDRKKLAHSLSLSDRQVKTWFQNRRAKLRKCKGGLCTESEASGSPQDSRALSPQNEVIHFDNRRDANNVTQFNGSE